MPTTVRGPADFLRRYVLGRGTYPAKIDLRTPCGPLALEVYSPEDVATINEIFCRRDYEVPRSARTFVDIGANIGISASYFLPRSAEARVWCYEPAPQNIPRLRRQLERFGDRVQIHESAIGVEDGEVEFSVEPTGRYGSAARFPDGYERITVPSLSINTVLEDVLSVTETIDVLKLDTEGLERRTVEAIRPELAARIGLMVFEPDEPDGYRLLPLHPMLFDASFDGVTNRLVRKNGQAVSPSVRR